MKLAAARPSMDHTIRVCRCFGPKQGESGCLHGCMGTTPAAAANSLRAAFCCPPRHSSDVATKNPEVLQNPELVRKRKPSPSRLPLLSPPPHVGGHARGRHNPATNINTNYNSMDASGRKSRRNKRRTTRQRGFPRRNDLCSSSSSVGRVNQPRMTRMIAPPRSLGTMMSNDDKKGAPAQPPSTTEENSLPTKKHTEGANVEEPNSHSIGGGRDLHSISVSAKSFRPTVDFLGSVDSTDSTKSLRTPAHAREELPQDNDFFAEADDGTLATDGQAKRGVPTVEETICESWKELPWQARLCPRAIEEREDVRRACALENESQRVQAWRQEQQILTSNAAREEERKLSHWWKGQAKKVWKLESQRRRCHERLSTLHEACISALESQRTNVIGSGYGEELATLAKRDRSEHVERMNRIETVFALIPHTVNSSASARDPSASGSAENITRIATPEALIVGREPRHALSQEEVDDCVARISAQALFELEQVALHASESAAAARLSSRRRQSLAYLTYEGLKSLYRDARGRARHTFVSECAADVARVKKLASVGKPRAPVGETNGCSNGYPNGNPNGCPNGYPNGYPGGSHAAADGEVEVGPDAAWDRERRRVTAEIDSEASRVACWTRLQRQVFRRCIANVLRLLVADSERRPLVDSGGAVWSWGSRGGGTRGGGDSIVAVRKRGRAVLHELKRRQAEASAEAESFRRSWMAALAEWKAQLRRAQHTAARREAAELRVLQRKDAEAVAIREDIVTSSLTKRGERQGCSWGAVFNSEISRINDAAGAWRHCFLAASNKLKELVESARRERLRVAESWKKKMARASDRSQALTTLMDEEQGRLEDEHSSLVADLVKIVADNTAKATEIADEASRTWWTAASAGLVSLFSAACVGEPRGCGDQEKYRRDSRPQGCDGRESPRRDCLNIEAEPTGVGSTGSAAAPAPAAAILVARLSSMNHAEELRFAKNAADIVGVENGPLHLAVEEEKRRQKKAIDRCEAALARADHDGDSPPRACARTTGASAALAAVVAGAPPAAAVPASPAGECGGGSGGDSDGVVQPAEERRTGECGDVGDCGVQTAEELDRFREQLEADTIQLATAPFEDEVKRLDTDGAKDVAPVTRAEASPLPDAPPPPRDLTKSQLDLRRAADIRAYVRSLGLMLLRARKVLVEEIVQANDADREEHDHNAATAESCHLRRLDDLKERARATTNEALQTALAEADRLARGASETSRVANGARLVVIDSAVGWIDRAARVEANTSERRLRKRKDHVALRATAMAEFDQTVSKEQRDWLCRVRERGREALTAARLAVTDRVEEIICGHRGERTDEQRGGGLVTATSCDDGAQIDPCSSEVLRLEAPATREKEKELTASVVRLDASLTRETEEEEQLLVEGGVSSETGIPSTTRDLQEKEHDIDTVAVGVAADCNGSGDDVHDDDTSHVTMMTNGLPPPPSVDELLVDGIAPLPSLDELQVESFLAVQSAAGASCSAGVDAWAEAARSRAQALSDSLSSEAASDYNEERLAVETEWKTLELAFCAARKEAGEAIVASWRAGWGAGIPAPEEVEKARDTVKKERDSSSGDVDSLEQVETSRGTGEIARDGGGDLESDNGGGCDSSVPTLTAKEQEECNRLWESLERPVACHIRTATTTKNAGIGLPIEEVKSVADEAVARVAELEAELRSAIADTAATGENDVRTMVAAGREQLCLAFVRAQEEQLHAASERAQEEQAHLASVGAQEVQAHLASAGVQEERALTEHGRAQEEEKSPTE